MFFFSYGKNWIINKSMIKFILKRAKYSSYSWVITNHCLKCQRPVKIKADAYNHSTFYFILFYFILFIFYSLVQHLKSLCECSRYSFSFHIFIIFQIARNLRLHITSQCFGVSRVIGNSIAKSLSISFGPPLSNGL